MAGTIIKSRPENTRGEELQQLGDRPCANAGADGNAVPRSEIEIGAVCPPAYVAAGDACAEHQSVIVNFHWVRPCAVGVNSNNCPQEDFNVVLSVNGKLAFPADGTLINSNSASYRGKNRRPQRPLVVATGRVVRRCSYSC